MEAVNPTSTNRDLLGDLDEIITLNYASKGQRFGNYVIDAIAACAFYGLTGIGLAVLIDSSGGDSDVFFDGFLGYVVAYSLFTVYFTLLEGLNKGRTLGKLITGTYAVSMDGKPLTMRQALYRSLCRIVPFEPLSGLGSAPWHDRWTETTVVIKNK